MSRLITVSLDKRGVSCVARMLDDEAPRTCAAVWDALPLSAAVFHGKYARNEIYTLLPAFAPADPGKENTTITPIPGDLCWFSFDSDVLGQPGIWLRKLHRHRHNRRDRRPCVVLRAEQPADQRGPGLGAGQCLRCCHRGARRDGRGVSGPVDGRRARRDAELHPPRLILVVTRRAEPAIDAAKSHASDGTPG